MNLKLRVPPAFGGKKNLESPFSILFWLLTCNFCFEDFVKWTSVWFQEDLWVPPWASWMRWACLQELSSRMKGEWTCPIGKPLLCQMELCQQAAQWRNLFLEGLTPVMKVLWSQERWTIWVAVPPDPLLTCTGLPNCCSKCCVLICRRNKVNPFFRKETEWFSCCFVL